MNTTKHYIIKHTRIQQKLMDDTNENDHTSRSTKCCTGM